YPSSSLRAERSNPGRSTQALDCRVASLLAMTRISVPQRGHHQRLRSGVERHRSLRQSLRHFLAQLDTELVEGIDAEQDSIGENAMLIESDQRAEAARADLIEQDGRRGPVARIVARAILARPPRHQCRA